MARDYKQRPKVRRPPPRRKPASRIGPGTSFGVGICVGAIVTVLIFVNGARLSPGDLVANLGGGGDDNQPEETTFEFYTVLPGKEIVVPDTAPAPPPPVTPAKEKKADPDSRQFMLQAASFRRDSDADELKARLALLGLEASVQRVNLKDSGTWFRVRLGPYKGQQAMESVKARLKGQNIQVLTTRLR